MAADSKDNPDAACLPIGYMQSHSQPRKPVQSRGLIVIIYQANAGTRQIFVRVETSSRSGYCGS